MPQPNGARNPVNPVALVKKRSGKAVVKSVVLDASQWRWLRQAATEAGYKSQSAYLRELLDEWRDLAAR